MSRLKVAAAVLTAGGALLTVALGGGWVFLGSTVDQMFVETHQVHAGDFPIPFPLTPAEIDALRAERMAAMPPSTDPDAPPPDPLAGVDLDAIARERAAARGKHLVEARYACVECHGHDFGGGKMIDDPKVGKIMGANLTLGAGSATKDYTAKDWDRKVRHGVNPDGTAGMMPSGDYQLMSDRELSDIVTYLRTQPPVDRQTPPREIGPILRLVLGTGQAKLAVDEITQVDHHEAEPPPEGPTVEYGHHLAGVCTGCHRATLQGGPMAGGPPDWATPQNLTTGEGGLSGWTYDDFAKLMRSGVRKDGTTVKVPMAMMVPYGANMTDVELQALWTYLQQLPPLPTGT